MGLFTPPEDLLISAMVAKQPQVRLEHCIGSIEGVFKSALKKIEGFWPFYQVTKPIT